MWVSANAMLSVPSVTMNAGNPHERHQAAVQHPEGDAGQDPERDREQRRTCRCRWRASSSRSVRAPSPFRPRGRSRRSGSRASARSRARRRPSPAAARARGSGRRRKRSDLTEKKAIASTQRDERPDGRRREHAAARARARRIACPGRPLRWCRSSSRSASGRMRRSYGAVGSGRDRGAGWRPPRSRQERVG